MPRLLLLLPSLTYRAEAFLEAAHRLSISITVGGDFQSLVTLATQDSFLPLELQDPESALSTVESFSKRCPLDAVIGVNDNTTLLASQISDALGLPSNPVSAVSAARNKYLMRECFRDHGLPTPPFILCHMDDDPNELSTRIQFPCVLKPLTLSASCGVMRADDVKSFATAFHRVGAILQTLGLPDTEEAGAQILIEGYLPGIEVAVEGLLTDGNFRPLAVYDKLDPLTGPFFEETIYVTPTRLPTETQSGVFRALSEAAAALGLKEGPVHGEVRIHETGMWVIEIAARTIGGQCSRTLRFSTGMSLEELIIRHALHMDILAFDREENASGVMMIPIPERGILESVEGVSEARRVQGIEELSLTIQPGEHLVPLPEGTRYLGFLIARGKQPEEVEAALRNAHRHLRFTVRPLASSNPPPGVIQV